MTKEEQKLTSLYEIFGNIINGVALFFLSPASLTSPYNRVIKILVILLIIILVGLYYLLREQFKIYDNNNDIANQIYFYLSIVLFITTFFYMLKLE
jgi:Kef-type K+ transport system membrane component KefB